ncbi:metallophosphoesterase [Verrucomicrobia bacterium SCGC AG-212-E04]|nr:metallophosphoesterase [Verrucomicrobia bacterium SCGC AG-212-E04]
MILALLSDIHGNLEALHACLKHARRAGAGRLVFLGDLVGYGADPAAVVELIRREAADGAIVLRGNHDDAVANPASYMHDSAKDAMDWARQALSEDERSFLAQLPLIVREDPMCFVHASAVAPERWNYVDTADAAQRCAEASGCTYTFCGHVHHQMLHFQRSEGAMSAFRPVPGSAIPMRGHRRWVAVVGSVGQPRDRTPAAAYALFDLDGSKITFWRVPYDHLAAARKIREAGLPATLARRVELGI